VATLSQFAFPMLIAPITGVPMGGAGAAAERSRTPTPPMPPAGPYGPPAPGDDPALPRLLALSVLAHVICIVSHPPLVAALCTLLLHPRLDLALVQLSQVRDRG